ncbi:hypothetical protein D3C73_1513270 [compost metagenome]
MKESFIFFDIRIGLIEKFGDLTFAYIADPMSPKLHNTQVRHQIKPACMVDRKHARIRQANNRSAAEL